MNRLFLTAISAFSMASTASAASLVDTDTPVGYKTYSLFNNQSLAGFFTIVDPITITSIEGFITNFAANNSVVVATLYSDGILSSSSNAIFSTSFDVAGASEIWAGKAGLNWGVTPGNYWLGFSSNDEMGLRDGAPSPLSNYAYTSSGNWFADTRLGLGIRVNGTVGAVPEPATWTLLLLGLAAIGGTMRSKRREHAISLSYA